MTAGEAEDRAITIFAEVEKAKKTILSEEDAKVRVINRILCECLGWQTNAFRMETKHANGYSDYIILNGNEDPCLLIEAKRTGKIRIDLAEKDKEQHLKISGSSLKWAQDGIDQAFSYASPNGLPVAILTDGFSWVIFKPFVSGSHYKDKEAIVFATPKAILNHFSRFYELLSRESFGKRLYSRMFDDIHNKRLALYQNLTPALDGTSITLAEESELSADLDKIFDIFFSKLTGTGDEDFLLDCFVETRESRIADFSLEKMTLNFLRNITKDKNLDSELLKLISFSVDENISHEYDSGQNIFIVGSTGAGKTTFLERFFKRTLPLSVKNRCVVLNVNCLDATGDNESVISWITESLINGLEKELYDGYPTWGDLRSLYHGDYLKRAMGVDEKLYKSDKEAFQLKFSEFLEEKTENDRIGYLQRILSDAVNNRDKLPIIIIDNSDEFGADYKLKVFQYTQSLRRHVNHCLLMFPVTDKSAWSFSKTDIYGIYKSQSFFLPTPSPRDVFQKRIAYIEKKLEESKVSNSSKGSYFLNRGIKLSINELSGFAKVLENVFVERDYVSKTLGQLTNYNIRRTMVLSHRVITSSVFDTDDLLKSYLKGSSVTTNFTKFMNALMKGKYSEYRQSDNVEIFPVFQVDPSIRQSPLICLRILALLDSIFSSRHIEDRHMNIQSLVSYFDALGCSERAIEAALSLLLENGLVEAYDPSNKDISNEQRLAISHRGRAHLTLGSKNNVFFYQMALTTPISDEDTALKIRSIYKSNESAMDKIDKIRKEFLTYLLNTDRIHVATDIDSESYLNQQALIDNLNKFSKNIGLNDGLIDTLGEDFKNGIVKQGVLAVVDNFIKEKGYGFANLEDVDGKIFFHVSSITKDGFDSDSIADGDILLCDLSREPKGLCLENIQDIEAGEKSPTVECKVIRIHEDRSYGFVRIEGSEKEAFFHITSFPEEFRENIQLNQKILAEIVTDKRASGFQVKRIVKV